MSQTQSNPTHLDPSELGTKEYWDEYYERDLNDGDDEESGIKDGRLDEDEDEESDEEEPPDPSELDSWFDDVGAPAKTLAFLTSTTFPLSPNYAVPTESNGGVTVRRAPSVLDLGTGNGSALFSLCLQGDYSGRMVGVDYSSKSIELAKRLRSQYASSISSTDLPGDPDTNNIAFHVFDIINDAPSSRPWWPARESGTESGFDLVLDKGTFDAISLSPSTIFNPLTNCEQRVCELYPSKVLEMVKPSGFLLVTSCNWTEGEVVSWFTSASTSREGDKGRFEVYETIKYPVFEFGGQKGQGVVSICFKKVRGK